MTLRGGLTGGEHVYQILGSAYFNTNVTVTTPGGVGSVYMVRPCLCLTLTRKSMHPPLRLR